MHTFSILIYIILDDKNLINLCTYNLKISRYYYYYFILNCFTNSKIIIEKALTYVKPHYKNLPCSARKIIRLVKRKH